MLKIIVNRDSVCMADDMKDHSLACYMENDATYTDLFSKIKKLKYLPNVSGNNVVWVLQSKKHECIFSYFTFTDKYSPSLSQKNLSRLCEQDNHLHFKYFTSPGKWKEYIMKMYNGDGYVMWKDGWLDEIKYCDYLESL